MGILINGFESAVCSLEIYAATLRIEANQGIHPIANNAHAKQLEIQCALYREIIKKAKGESL